MCLSIRTRKRRIFCSCFSIASASRRASLTTSSATTSFTSSFSRSSPICSQVNCSTRKLAFLEFFLDYLPYRSPISCNTRKQIGFVININRKATQFFIDIFSLVLDVSANVALDITPAIASQRRMGTR